MAQDEIIEMQREGDIIEVMNRKLKIDDLEVTEVDGKTKNEFEYRKMIAAGMMDIALLTANANQLRFLITYNQKSKSYYVNFVLIIISLILQVVIGTLLIIQKQMRIRRKTKIGNIISTFLVVGIFIVTVINVFVAAFTTTDTLLSQN